MYAILFGALASVFTVYYVVNIDAASGNGGTPNWIDKNCKDDYEVGHIKLAVMFTPGFCGARYPPILCHNRPKPIFSIHGLWPELKGRYAYPNQPTCCTTHTYSESSSALQPLMDRLDNNWATMLTSNTNSQFRNDEWIKHGICGYKVEGINDPVKYAKTALDLLDRFDFETMMRRKGIYMSNTKTYSAETLYSAFKDETGYDAELSCLKPRNKRETFLVEIRLCFDPVLPFRQRNCPTRGYCTGSISVPEPAY